MKGFLSDLTLLCFLPTGNYTTGDFSTPLRSARNDKSAARCVSYERLFANRFPSGLPLWCFSPLSFRAVVQVRISSMPHGAGETESRNLLLKGFLSGLTLWCFLPTGNCLRIVSHPAWHFRFPYRPETIRPEISRLRFAPLEMTNRRPAAFHMRDCLQIVSRPACLYGASPLCHFERWYKSVYPLCLMEPVKRSREISYSKGSPSALTLWWFLPAGNPKTRQPSAAGFFLKGYSLKYRYFP